MRVLVTGAGGFFGHNFFARHAGRFELTGVWRARRPAQGGLQADLADPGALEGLWRTVRPEAVLHLAAMTAVADCERDPGRARAINVEATARLAALAAADGVRMLFTSTDLVFDGAHAPYAESDPPVPLHEYGRTKVAGERAVLETGGPHLVCRVALCYGPLPDGGLRQLDWILRAAREGRTAPLYDDEFRTPIDSLTLADCLAELLEGGITGLLHLGGPERWSRLEFGRAVLARAGTDPGLARPASASASEVPRPADVSLAIDRARAVLRTPLLGLAAGLERVFTSPS